MVAAHTWVQIPERDRTASFLQPFASLIDCLSPVMSFTGRETSVLVLPYTNAACFIRFYLLTVCLKMCLLLAVKLVFLFCLTLTLHVS